MTFIGEMSSTIRHLSRSNVALDDPRNSLRLKPPNRPTYLAAVSRSSLTPEDCGLLSKKFIISGVTGCFRTVGAEIGP